MVSSFKILFIVANLLLELFSIVHGKWHAFEDAKHPTVLKLIRYISETPPSPLGGNVIYTQPFDRKSETSNQHHIKQLILNGLI